MLAWITPFDAAMSALVIAAGRDKVDAADADAGELLHRRGIAQRQTVTRAGDDLQFVPPFIVRSIVPGSSWPQDSTAHDMVLQQRPQPHGARA